MRNKVSYIIAACTAIMLFGGCKKWLDVQPGDKFTEPQIFTNRNGAEKALNGIYLQLAKQDLYGKDLTMGTLEIFAQRYNIGTQHNLKNFQAYAWDEKNVKENLAAIWESGYVAIVNANQFIRNLDTYTGNDIRPDIDSLLRGEAIALRAMLHFDILRMFGPVYNSADSAKESVPYYSTPSYAAAPLLPANQAIDSILKDLYQAEQLLQHDPVITQGVVIETENDGNDFYRNRNQRINLYAVKALQARVHLYREDKVKALQAATWFMANGEKHFPWITPARIMSDKVNPNRVFSHELIFCITDLQLYDRYKETFAPELSDGKILAPNDTRLKAVFETNESDYRYNPLWILPSAGGKSYRTFYKYADVQNKDSSFRYKIPLIRKSEMYYIAAECETDPNQARIYLNTVRFNRGLANISATANLNTEIQKEYMKEFFGEGQLFFYYKRRKVATVPNSAATAGNVTLTGKYVFPMPLSETQFR